MGSGDGDAVGSCDGPNEGEAVSPSSVGLELGMVLGALDGQGVGLMVLG